MLKIIKKTEEYKSYTRYVKNYFEKRKSEKEENFKKLFEVRFEIYFDTTTRAAIKEKLESEDDFFNVIIDGCKNIAGEEIKNLNGLVADENIFDSLNAIIFDDKERCKFITYLIFNYYIFKIFNIFEKKDISVDKKNISIDKIKYYILHCENSISQNNVNFRV